MGAETNYSGANGARIQSHGGPVRVTCVSNEGQGNGGTSLPCAGCWVQAAIDNTEVVKMSIDVAATAVLGVDLARPQIYDGTTEASAAAAQPMWVNIDDVSKIYFYSVDANAIIDILYLT